MKHISVNPDQSPLMILDIVFKMHVRDIMTREVVSVSRHESMRRIKELMRDHGVTGVPIVENDRLYGMVTIENLMTALESGRLDDEAHRHMASRVITLEDDMPLSFAISYFSKYPFRRFPVLDKQGRLVGIVTTRDINVSLLTELFKELKQVERRLDETQMLEEPGIECRKVYHLPQHDFENAGKASTEIKAHLQQHGVNSRIIRRVAVAAYELEINIVAHSVGGTLVFSVNKDKVEIIAQDTGPGIPDVDKALTEGFSTADDWIKSLGFGAGMGLPNVRRVSDEFEIQSIVGAGTTVKVTVQLKQEEQKS